MDKSDSYLITGSTGQLGPMVLRSLIEKWVEPTSAHLLVRNAEKAKQVLESHKIPQLPLIVGDITETTESLLQKIPQQINHVVHMAGSVKFGEKFRGEVEKINKYWAINMAHVALMRNGLLTHISTAYILGEVDSELPQDFINETTKRVPKNPYEEAKWDAEVAITNLFEGRKDSLQILRPSILTDSIARPDLWWELHAAMWYYAPFIMLRRELNKRWETGWVDLSWFKFVGHYANEINIIDNTLAGEEIAGLIISHAWRARNIVNAAAPTYGDLTGYVLENLRFTNYIVEEQPYVQQWTETSPKKITDIEKWNGLLGLTRKLYIKNSVPNYRPYATHVSHFSGGILMDNEALAGHAVRSLINES